MNTFYHAFTPGFNVWYVVLPLFIVVSYVIGTRFVQVKRVKHNTYRVYHTTSLHDATVSAVMAIIVGVLIYVESAAGLIQTFDNLGGGDPGDPTGVYSLLFAGMALVVFVGLLAFAYFIVLETAKRRKIQSFAEKFFKRSASYYFKTNYTIVDVVASAFKCGHRRA